MRVQQSPIGARFSPRGRKTAFTLVELLIVIGIIALLVGILLPAVGRVRIASQKIATQNTLNRLTQGIEAYYQDYGSYPGPFSDDQIVSSAMTSPTPTPVLGNTVFTLQYPDPTNPTAYINLNHAPTSSENLFLGLCGGLKIVTTVSAGVPSITGFHYDPAAALRGVGPSSLNLNNYKKSQSYLDLTLADVSADEANANPLNMTGSQPSNWWPGTAGGGVALNGVFLGDSPICEFMDRFAKPMPILYLRAQRGVTRLNASLTTDKTGFIYDPFDTVNTRAPYQYRPDQIEYSYSNVNRVPGGHQNAAGPMSGDPQAGFYWTADPLDYPDLHLDPTNTGSAVKIQKGNDRYYANEAVSTGDPSTLNDASKSLTPVYKDKYILISAGPDGIYGTADDIRN